MAVAPTIRLNDGNQMPAIGLGTANPKVFDSDPAAIQALEIGYRHFDTAWMYANQQMLGDALRKGMVQLGLKREDLSSSHPNFRHGKFRCPTRRCALVKLKRKIMYDDIMYECAQVWHTYHKKENAIKNCQVTLDQLKFDYVDLLLVHSPLGFKEDSEDPFPVDAGGKTVYSDVDFIETWKGLEECLKKGMAKSIGVSNFSIQGLKRLLPTCTIKPVCNQVESHPYLDRKELLDFCKEQGIIVTTFGPLGAPYSAPAFNPKISIDRNVHVLEDPVIVDLEHNKTAAQVILRWAFQRGTVPLPRSNNKKRLAENFAIFDFELSSDEMKQIDGLNQAKRAYPYDAFSDHPLYKDHVDSTLNRA